MDHQKQKVLPCMVPRAVMVRPTQSTELLIWGPCCTPESSKNTLRWVHSQLHLNGQQMIFWRKLSCWSCWFEVQLDILNWIANAICSMLARQVQEVHILCKIEGREDKNDPREGLDCLKHWCRYCFFQPSFGLFGHAQLNILLRTNIRNFLADSRYDRAISTVFQALRDSSNLPI